MKEDLPSILISDGWETDNNDALVEVVIPSTVATYQNPTKVTFLGETLNWIPSTVAALQEFEGPNVISLSSLLFTGYSYLTTVKFDNLTSLTSLGSNTGMFMNCVALTTAYMPKLEAVLSGGSNNSGLFRACTSLESVSFPELLTIEDRQGGIFYSCTSLTSVSLPKLTTIIGGTSSSVGSSTFYNCTSLTTISLPKLQTTTTPHSSYGTFNGCTGLTTVTLGSEGNPVSSLGNNTFKNCTQSGLTITIYTQGGASLSGSPWGATKATIVYESA